MIIALVVIIVLLFVVFGISAFLVGAEQKRISIQNEKTAKEIEKEMSKTAYQRNLEKNMFEEDKNAKEDEKNIRNKSGRNRFNAACDVMQDNGSSEAD